MKKCLVIYNPNSGKHNMEEILPKIKKLLNNYKIVMVKLWWK